MTICCAAADEAAVREAADALVARGHQVELAIGVDADPEVLTRAIAAQNRRGLFVLCRSGSLDRNAVDELREILRTHDVPFGRTLTLAVDAQRSRELEERIVSVLRRMVTGRTDGRARSWGSNPPPDDDPDTTVRRPGGAKKDDPAAILQGLGTEPENADPYASTSQIEVVHGNGGQIMPPEYTPTEHTAIAPAPKAPPSATPTAPVPALSPAASLADDEPEAVTAPNPRLPRPPGPELGAEDSVPSEASSAPVVAPTMPGSPEPLLAYGSSALGPSPDESSTDFEPPLTFGGRMGRVLSSPTGLAAVLGGLAVVVLLVIIISLIGGDDEKESNEQAKSTATKAADEALAKAKGDAEPDQSKPEDAKSDAEPEPTDDAEVKPAEDTKAEGAAPAADATPAADAAADDAAAADPGDAPSRPAPAAAGDEDPPEVVEALKNREVRALDIFLVAPERKGNLDYESSVDYCNDLEVAGLREWRVPTIGELNSVASAKMVGKSIYWSSTLGDAFGDMMLVFNAKKDRISVVTRGWDGAKVVCIRPRRPS